MPEDSGCDTIAMVAKVLMQIIHRGSRERVRRGVSSFAVAMEVVVVFAEFLVCGE
jgi:hypothetical protein